MTSLIIIIFCLHIIFGAVFSEKIPQAVIL